MEKDYGSALRLVPVFLFDLHAGVEVELGSPEYMVNESSGILTISVAVVSDVVLDRDFQVNVVIQPGNGTYVSCVAALAILCR